MRKCKDLLQKVENQNHKHVFLQTKTFAKINGVFTDMSHKNRRY